MDEEKYEVGIEVQEEIAEEEDNNYVEYDESYIKMDFSLETPEERNALVQKIIEQTPPEKLTHKYLEKLAHYDISSD